MVDAGHHCSALSLPSRYAHIGRYSRYSDSCCRLSDGVRRSASSRAPRPHGERAKGLGIERIGSDQHGCAPGAPLDRQREQARTPLGRAGQTPPRGAGAILSIDRKKIGPHFDDGRLRAMPRHSGQSAEGKESECGSNGASGAQPGCERRMDGGGRHADTDGQNEMKRRGAAQQDARRTRAPREKNGIAAGRSIRRSRFTLDADQT